MKGKYYICERAITCQHIGTEYCAFGTPTSKNALDALCNGTFRPEFSINCNHPKINAGVMLINLGHTHIEGNYRTIWTPF